MRCPLASIAWLSALSVVMLPVSGAAQTNPPPPDPAAAKPANDAAAAALAAGEGIPLSAAKSALDLQTQISVFLQSSDVVRQSGFSELYVRYKPYQIVLSFDSAASVDTIKAAVPEGLRPFVTVETTGRSQASQLDVIGKLNAALAAFKGKIAVGYLPASTTFIVDTADDGVTRQITPLIPAALQSFVKINSGGLPRSSVSTTAVPSGVRSGDYAEAGYALTRSDGSSACTLAYPVTFGSGLQGILTAGHCVPGGANTITYSDHKVTFPDAYYLNNSGNYDLALYRTDGLQSDYQLYYNNSQGTPGYASSGWLNTKNFVRLANQWVGMYTCKSGVTTGLTCAKIVSKTYDWGRSGAIFVKWASSSATQYIADYGDSGSAVFATLDSSKSTEISAVGILVGGHAQDADGYVGVYMPIDRVFDAAASLKLKTTP